MSVIGMLRRLPGGRTLKTCPTEDHARITGGTCLWQLYWFPILRMSMGSRWVRIALVVITLGLALLWGGSLGVIQATGEYLWPTTVQLMPLPADCVPSNEAPSPEALRIVQYQKSFYQLALQETVVCRTPRKFSNIEPDFTEQVFDQSTRRKWLPLYVGCCSYKYRRHVAIIIAQQDERGSLISQAALIQSRRKFLRSNWTKIGRP
jgi:hypothetical protein